MKAIGYCRVSTEEQVLEGFSLDTQEQEIKRYCQEKNIELLNVYIDGGVSAYKNALKDRPQGKFVIEHILNKSIDCIVAISDDRMFRQLEHLIYKMKMGIKSEKKYQDFEIEYRIAV